MDSKSLKYIHEIKVLGLEKIRKEISGKRYEFVLKVKWSNGTEATIYRPHSMFFDFQGVLAEMFQDVKIPNAPVVRFHWALLGKLGHEKECKVMEDFCQKIIRLPPHVSKASIVLHFFEAWGTDVRTNVKTSELFDPEVGRSSIQSSQERSKSGTTDKEDQYRVLASYEATNIGETSLVEGSFVTIIEKNERGWWFVAHDDGRQGWAPATYLEPAVLEEGGDGDCYDWHSVTDAQGNGEKYVSMVAYTAQNSDELSYSAGQEIEALKKSSYGWWTVRINGQVGITPATNLQKVDEPATLYQSVDELKRTVSISSASGLYAVIRKPPPRRESVRSRSSSGMSTLMQPPDSILNGNSLTGKKPSRFVYSATSFSGGKFVIGEEDQQDIDNSFLPSPPPATDLRRASADDILQSRETYENVDSETLNHHQQPMKTVRSKSETPEVIALGQQVKNMHSYFNYRRSMDNSDAQFYVALLDYDPGHQRKDDVVLSKGDIVQLISADSGWMFVLLLKDNFDRQGWVPETYLERKLDVDVSLLTSIGKDSPKPKPRPRPAPRPRTKPNEPLPPIPPDATKRPSITPPPNLGEMHGHTVNNQRQESDEEEDLYDEPEMTLRSVYDSEPWYFGAISRADCERQLSTFGRQQEFLIRDSQRAKGSYALSVKYCYRIRHFPIEAVSGGQLLIGKLKFPTLMDIVDYYQKNPLFFSEHKEPISLGTAFSKDRVK